MQVSGLSVHSAVAFARNLSLVLVRGTDAVWGFGLWLGLRSPRICFTIKLKIGRLGGPISEALPNGQFAQSVVVASLLSTLGSATLLL